MTNPSQASPTAPPLLQKAILSAAVLVAMALILIPPYLQDGPLPWHEEWFRDSDTYMRMVRVRDWWDGGAWYANASARSNWPFGETLHWARPLDIVLVALALPLSPLLGMEKALFAAGVVVSPIAYLLALAALLWGARPLLNLGGQVAMIVLFALQPTTHSYFSVARPDHHSLILLCFAVTLACLTRHAIAPGGDKRLMALAGAAAALGVWISIESLAAVLFALLALGLMWAATGKEAWIDALGRFTLVLGGLTILALAVERPTAEWLRSEEYDRISTVHAVLMALIALGVQGIRRTAPRLAPTVPNRVGIALAWAAAAGGIMALLYPDFLKGPFGAAMDPQLSEMWLSKVDEFQPLIKTNDPATYVKAIFIIGPAVWVAVWIRLSLADAQTQTHALILTLGLAVAFYIPLNLSQSRWGAYTGIALVTPLALLLQRLLAWEGGPRWRGAPVLRAPAVLLVATGHILIAMALYSAPEEEAPAKPHCQWRSIAPFLNGPDFGGGAPQTVLSFIHEGPEILYRTPHRVVGTPYHRNRDGLLDSFVVFSGTDEARTKAVMDRRGVDYVITCNNAVEEEFFLSFPGETMMRRIVSGRVPEWLAPVALPDGLGEHFHLFKVQK